MSVAERGPETAPSDNLGRLAARGGVAALSGQLARMVVQFASVTVLARMLGPSDYGLIAMAMAVIALGDIFRDFGLFSAAVQAPTLTRAQRDNLFWVSTAIGGALGLLVAACAPLVADFYSRPELVAIVRALAITFLINGMASQYRAGLTREMRFSTLAKIDVAAALLGLGGAVLLARSGAGYWALVGQQTGQLALMLLLITVVSRWRPRRPDRTAPMVPLLRFGWHLVGSQLITYAGNNLDSVIIGNRFGAAQLGFYNRAYQLLMGPLAQMLSPSTTVALPVLGRLRDDEDRFAQYLVRAQLAMGYTLVAGLGLLAGVAEPVTRLLLGDTWLPLAPILRLMAAAGGLQTLAFVGYWVYVSRGLTAELRRFSVISTVNRVVCIAVGSHWGVMGVAWGFTAAPAIAWPLSIWWLSRCTPLPARDLWLGALRIMFVAVATGAVGYAGTRLMGDVGTVAQLGGGAVLGLLAYAAASTALPLLRSDIRAVALVARKGVRR